MLKAHLNILIQLAKVDGEVAEQELNLINEIGRANGCDEVDVLRMFKAEQPFDDFSKMSDDDKFELIYSVVQLMKIDGKLYNEEIEYCAKMASKLGYDKVVLFELMLKIYADPDICEDKETLKKQIQGFLNP